MNYERPAYAEELPLGVEAPPHDYTYDYILDGAVGGGGARVGWVMGCSFGVGEGGRMLWVSGAAMGQGRSSWHVLHLRHILQKACSTLFTTSLLLCTLIMYCYIVHNNLLLLCSLVFCYDNALRHSATTAHCSIIIN